ncbi:hypothetical protein D1007_62063 [Hordeum vulgare]|nr:hypothetical protein D1007_62063 [Hordeum vulgare]
MRPSWPSTSRARAYLDQARPRARAYRRSSHRMSSLPPFRLLRCRPNPRAGPADTPSGRRAAARGQPCPEILPTATHVAVAPSRRPFGLSRGDTRSMLPPVGSLPLAIGSPRGCPDPRATATPPLRVVAPDTRSTLPPRGLPCVAPSGRSAATHSPLCHLRASTPCGMHRAASLGSGTPSSAPVFVTLLGSPRLLRASSLHS